MRQAEGVVKTVQASEDGLDGLLGYAEGGDTLNGVLALGGSDGGVPHYLMRLLVQEGFVCLALAYFNTPRTQPALIEVPLERIERGLLWLRSQPGVRTRDGRLCVVGASKGAELALLIAATFPHLVGPVVAYTPSGVVWQGIDFATPRPPLRSSWSLGTQPLPFVPYPADVGPSMSAHGLSALPIYDRGLDDGEAVDQAVIPVERASGPLLLISGGDDRMWPAARMCEMVVDRMRGVGRGHLVRHLHFPRAGHVLFPYEPPKEAQGPPVSFDLGGSAEAAMDAHASAWPEVVRHLRGEPT